MVLNRGNNRIPIKKIRFCDLGASSLHAGAPSKQRGFLQHFLSMAQDSQGLGTTAATR